jgi:hypothetical protein
VRLSVEHDKHSVYTEEKNWRFDTLSFEDKSTPQVISTHFYPTTSCEPSEATVRLNLTYQQVKGEQIERVGG